MRRTGGVVENNSNAVLGVGVTISIIAGFISGYANEGIWFYLNHDMFFIIFSHQMII
ncbi:hypothetical protein ACJX0J_017802, partial [Zea mays]